MTALKNFIFLAVLAVAIVSVTATSQYGKSVKYGPDGSVTITGPGTLAFIGGPDGSFIFRCFDNSVVQVGADGSFVVTKSDGSSYKGGANSLSPAQRAQYRQTYLDYAKGAYA